MKISLKYNIKHKARMEKFEKSGTVSKEDGDRGKEDTKHHSFSWFWEFENQLLNGTQKLSGLYQGC